MDPITFGAVFVGTTGGTLLVLSLMGKKISINEQMLKLTLEAIKYGSILYLLNKVFHTFL